jgi:uncharacterized Zn-finger protein
MESFPKLHNEIGVPMVRIGCHEFECIGDKPPQDHPHIYLNMGDASEIVCPYAPRYSVSIRPWAHAKLIQNLRSAGSQRLRIDPNATPAMVPFKAT